MLSCGLFCLLKETPAKIVDESTVRGVVTLQIEYITETTAKPNF